MMQDSTSTRVQELEAALQKLSERLVLAEYKGKRVLELATLIGCSDCEALQRAIGTELVMQDEIAKGSIILAVRPDGEKIRLDFKPHGNNHHSISPSVTP